MNASEWGALVLLATASTFTPGPNTALSTALAANFGLRGALHFVCAVPVGWGLLLALCATGLGTLVLAAPLLRGALLAAGAGYLLWLARRLSTTRVLARADASRLHISFWQGVLLQLVNIKAWMLALSIVAGWIAGQPDATTRTWQVLPILLAFGFASNLTYAAVGSLLREWLAHGTRLLVFNRCMAAALVLTAGWMVHSAR